MLYACYLIGFFLARILPLSMCYGLSSLVARIFFIFAKETKKNLKKNLNIIFDGKVEDKELNKRAVLVFEHFAKYLADFFKFYKFEESELSKKTNTEGLEYLDEGLRGGKGVILLTLHLGNWELGGAIVGSLGYPISAIVLEHASKYVNDFFIRQRALNNTISIPIGARLKECFKALKRNEIVAIVGDKDYTDNGICVDFFGKKAILPKGPAVIALRTGAPIVFCAIIRKQNNAYTMKFEKPIKFKKSGDHDEDERGLMSEYLRIFERYINAYPDQWYAFRKIWTQE